MGGGSEWVQREVNEMIRASGNRMENLPYSPFETEGDQIHWTGKRGETKLKYTVFKLVTEGNPSNQIRNRTDFNLSKLVDFNKDDM